MRRPRSLARTALVTWGLAALAMLATVAVAHAQQGNFLDGLIPTDGGSATGRIVQLVLLLTVLSVAPGLLIMVTSFTRFVIALSFLRSGLGLQGTPANIILISLSLFMTFYVMSPTFDRAWTDGLRPLLDNQIGEEEAFTRVTGPFRAFMLTQVSPKDLELFEELNQSRVAKSAPPASDVVTVNPAPATAPDASQAAEVDLRVLIPAFMVSELRRAFEIGFLIVLPFLIIDIIVGTLVMSMGMMMMPPVVLALPFKVLFFVLIDGWNLLIGGLVRSYF